MTVVFWAVMGAVPATACTFFVKTADGVTLAGNSEDYYEADTCAVIIPPSHGKYGRIYFGWTNVWMQGGVNEKGLAYDIMALWPKRFEKPPAGRVHEPGRLALIRRIMETCATVEEALELMKAHVNPIAGSGNWMLADATGDSAIIEGYTVIRREKSYQICTNFRWEKVGQNGWRDDRYKAAEKRLKTCPVTVEAFRDILTVVHQPLKNNNRGTLYSNIYDLANGKIYLYLLHDFERVKVLDMKEEFAKGLHTVRLDKYFQKSDREMGLRRRYEQRKRAAFRAGVKKLGGPFQNAATNAEPVLKLSLDGNAKDSSPRGQHGEVKGAEPCMDRHGIMGKAMQFSGLSSITVPSHDDLHLSSGDFTIAFWMRADACEDGGTEIVLDKFGRQSLDYMVVRTRGRLCVRFTGTNANLLLPDGIECGEWTHIAIRQDVAACRTALFLNCRELLSTMLHSTPQKNDTPLHLGSSGLMKRCGFHGALDDLVIYRRILENDEIAALAAN